jgi:hypothetical protein
MLHASLRSDAAATMVSGTFAETPKGHGQVGFRKDNQRARVTCRTDAGDDNLRHPQRVVNACCTHFLTYAWLLERHYGSEHLGDRVQRTVAYTVAALSAHDIAAVQAQVDSEYRRWHMMGNNSAKLLDEIAVGEDPGCAE